MSESLDILTIDANIRKNFEEEIEKLPHYSEKLKEINTLLEKPKLRRGIKDSLNKAKEELLVHVEDLENHKKYNFYLMETLPLIEEYKTILKTPIKVNFMGKSINTNFAW